MIRTSDGVILRVEPVRETSRLVVFLSRDYGKLVTLAKGVHRSEGRFVSPLDPMTLNRIVFYERPRTGLHLLTQCDLVDAFLPVRGALPAIASSFYMLELVDRVVQPGVGEAWLFSLLLESLQQLSRGVSPAILTRAFEIKLLARSGFMPEMKQCISCQKPLTERVSPRFQKGGFVCGRCQAPSADWRLSRGVVASLGHLATTEVSRLSRFKITKGDRSQLATLLEKFLEYHLEERPKSRAFLEGVNEAQTYGAKRT